MKRTTGTRAAAVAATLLAAGLATAVPANAAASHAATRITGVAQLHESIVKAAAHEGDVCSAGIAAQPMGGRPVGPPVTG